MSGYTKNIAVIRGLKDGFSADGGKLSGLIKAESYANTLKIEASLINFAPLSEGRYVIAVSDGAHTEIVEDCNFSGVSAVDTSEGFAAAVCYCNGGVQLIASAVCGDFHAAAFGLKEEIERQERSAKPVKAIKYEDEAISEVNYYEFAQTDEGGDPVRKDKEKKEDGRKLHEDEKAFGSVEEGARRLKLAGGNFYERKRSEIEGLLSTYPPFEELKKVMDGSEWVRIDCGEKFYLFGVISLDDKPRYICYAVPAQDDKKPPEGMEGLAAFLPVKTQHGMGFWVIYQDADSGANVKIEAR